MGKPTDLRPGSNQLLRDRAFWHVLALAFVLRAGLLICALAGHVPLVSTDTPTYTNPARSFMAQGVFSQDEAPPYAIDTLRTPGYPLLVAAVWTLTGTTSAVPVAVLQVVLSTVAVGFVFAAGYRLAGRSVAIIAGLLLAIESLSAAMGSYLMSDSLYQLCVAVWMFLLVRFVADRTWRNLVAASVIAGLGLYVRPVGLLFPLATALLALWAAALPWPRRLGQAAVAIAIAAIIVLPWCLRNHLGADTWELTTIASRNMLVYRAAKVMSMAEGKEFYKEAPAILQAEAQARTPPEATPGQRTRTQRAVAVEYMMRHPYLTAKAHAQGAVVLLLIPDRWSVPHLLGVDEQGGILHGSSGWVGKIRRLWRQYHGLTLAYMIWSGLFLAALWIAALVGWTAMWRSGRRVAAMAALLPLACLIAASAVPESEPRLRVPLMVPLVILSAVGFCTMWEFLKRRRERWTSTRG